MIFIEAIGQSFIKKSKEIPHCSSVIYPHRCQQDLQPLAGIKNIIAVGSGKGGVGKSTIAFNLATTLAASGLQVGCLDADIYGPSLPTLTGVFDRLKITDDKKFIPHHKFGIHFVSIGHLTEPSTALAWRGPMASGALMQLLQQTLWPMLDILIVDLPPGTGDLILTLCQKIPLAGVVIVSNPHPLAAADTQRATMLFEKMGIVSLLHTHNMQNDPEKGLFQSKIVYESTASETPLNFFAPLSAEQQVIQRWAESLVDSLAEQPIYAPVSFKI
jgi:Mrp family chromosome partitioning ATPase